jgi:hypothetical protein
MQAEPHYSSRNLFVGADIVFAFFRYPHFKGCAVNGAGNDHRTTPFFGIIDGIPGYVRENTSLSTTLC